MNSIKITCSNCNEEFDFDLDDMQSFCPHCGRKLLFDCEQIKTILSKKDKSTYYQEKIKLEQEQTKRTQLEFEHEERKHESDNQTRLNILLGCAVFIVLTIYLLFSMERKENNFHILNNELQITTSSEELIGQNYEDIVQIFKSIGFQNINPVGNDDLVLGILNKEGTVESVTINGNSNFEEGDWFPAHAIIKITYHTFSND